MSRLPNPGGDNGDWGNILNDFLEQAHQSDGLLKDGIVALDNIADNTVVDLTNDQTVGGVKTFSDSPIVPTPTTDGQAVNKGYVDTASVVVAGNTTGADPGTAIAIDSVAGTTGNTIASSDGAIAIGYDGTNFASATGSSSVAIGSDSVSSGYFSVALGATAQANDDSTTAIGWGAEASGEGSVAIGGGTFSESGSPGSFASGNNALSVGTSSVDGDYSIAMGQSGVTGISSTAIGYNNTIYGDNSVAMGYNNSTNSSSTAVIGRINTIDDSSSYVAAIGYNSNIIASYGGIALNGQLQSTDGSVAIQGGVYTGNGSTAISASINYANSAVAINGNVDTGDFSTAINGLVNSASGAVAIGADRDGNSAQATADNQFVLGTSEHAVQVPGNLEVMNTLQVDGVAVIPTSAPAGPQNGQIWVDSVGLWFQDASGSVHGPLA